MNEMDITKALHSLELSLARLEGKFDLIAERLDCLEQTNNEQRDSLKSMHELNASITLLAAQIEHQTTNLEERIQAIEATRLAVIETRQENMGIRIGALENKPAKKMEQIVTTLIGVVITAVFMYFFGRYTGGGG